MKLKKNKKRNYKKLILIVVLVLFVLATTLGITNYLSKTKIDRVLESSSYSYLPKEAKNYIKQVYEKTGEIVLTEKNKEENVPYLNPAYIDYLTLTETQQKEEGSIPYAYIVDYQDVQTTETDEIPKYYNLTNVNDKKFVPEEVRDQGGLGLCWAFSSAGVLESHILKTKDKSYDETAQLISERQLDYATSNNGIKDYKNEYVSFIDRELGDGGNFYISTIALANGISGVDYKSFKPYNDKDLEQMELSEVLNYNDSLYEVDATINMPVLDMRESTDNLTEEQLVEKQNYINEIKRSIMKYGAAHVSTYADSRCIYKDEKLNNSVIDVYHCPKEGGHAMQIIGWDDEAEYSYCADTLIHNADTSSCNNVVKGKGMWILKNSWGEDTPYPYLTYDSLNSQFHFIKELSSNRRRQWDNNYILGDGESYTNQKEYSLSDTKIKDNEELEKVKIITSSSGGTYNIKIKTVDGSYKEYSKTTDLPGLVSFYLSDVIVDKDSKVIISSENGTFIDKAIFITSDVEDTPYISLEKYDGMEISEHKLRFYSDTKRIWSDSEIIYKLYDENNNDVSDSISYEYNTIVENNINTLISFLPTLKNGKHRLDVIYDSKVINSIDIIYKKMEGEGTESNPYVITNPVQLDQIREDLDAYYVLGNDIDLTKATREGGKLYNQLTGSFAKLGGHGWEPILDFSGTLDGQGHTIKGLYQKNFIRVKDIGWSRRYNVGGLFGTANGNVTIKNIVLEDFDINCHGDCGVLLGYYVTTEDRADETEYNVNFSNIAIKNSNINFDDDDVVSSKIGGVFGRIDDWAEGKLNISNIYSDTNIGEFDLYKVGGLVSYIYMKNEINIKNIQLMGTLKGKYSDGSNAGVLAESIQSNKICVENILSTIYDEKIGGNLFNNVWGTAEGMIIKNLNMIKIPGRDLLRSHTANIKIETETINLYDKGINSQELSNSKNYETWSSFTENWIMKTVDGIPRYPVLKFVDFEYTNIDDLSIKQELNKKYNIYDYITPNTDVAKRIMYHSNNEDIVTIDENGYIIPQKSGKTTIHVESLYDGYIKDVPITVDYVPHYTIHFDSNDTEDYYKDIIGTMESIEVEAGKSFTLPANKFTQEYYEFKEWNTKPDGTGISYSDLSEIPAMNDKEEITLYVQWWGKERIVTFDPNGGTVTPNQKVVRIREKYGELPIPTRKGYGFDGWSSKGGGLPVDALEQISSLELVASWKEDAYTIIYDANGGKIPSDYKRDYIPYVISESLSTTYAYNGQEKQLSNNLYEKVGYKFKEWNTKADGSGTPYIEGQKIQLSNVENDTLKLYAIWEEKYSVTFDANGGTFNDNKTTITVEDWDDSKLESLEEPTKLGYIFKGFFTEKEGGSSLESYIEESGIDRDGLIFYAQWEEEKYSVTFDANGGTFNDDKITITVEDWDDSKLESLEEPTKDGYIFKGFFTEREGGTSLESYIAEAGIDKEGLIFYAQWEEELTYKIEDYIEDKDNNFIDNIDALTTKDTYKTKFRLGSKYRLELDLGTNEHVFTGSKTKLYKNDKLEIEFTNIVRGDIYADGKISALDYVSIKNHIMENEVITDEVFIRAADADFDSKISALDYVTIRTIIMEGAN